MELNNNIRISGTDEKAIVIEDINHETKKNAACELLDHFLRKH